MVGAKKVLVDGKEWYYPVSGLELFTDNVAKEFGIVLAPRTELNTEVVPEWFYKKEGSLVLPSKRVLLVSYTSSLEENLLKNDATNLGNGLFFERQHFKIMEGERHKETAVVGRLAEYAQYDLLYAFDRSEDSIERYGEKEDFRELFDDLFAEFNCRRYLEKGISHSRTIDLTEENAQKLQRLYAILVREN